jgi:hypothetical protein
MRSVLQNGCLIPKSGDDAGKIQQYVICLLSMRELPEIMALQETIVQQLHRSDILQPFSCDFMKQHLNGKGFVLGVFVKSRLVAFRNVYFPDKHDSTWNLGNDIGLGSSELDKVANLQMVCVHPDYRGNALAMRMNRLSLQLIRDNGAHEHVCATVSPYNYWNIRILLNCGFHIKKLKHKYRGKLRYVVHRQLGRPVTFEPGTAIEISLDDFTFQKILMDDGYCGLDIRAKKDHYRVCDIFKASQWKIVFERAK